MLNKINKYYLNFFSLCTALLCGSLTAASAYNTAELANSIKEITQKIDSLDIIKQDLKRKGQPVNEVERMQEQLRDSLHQIRSKVQKISITGPSISGKIDKNTPFSLKPSNLFDWIIIITGIIASFSGLILIIGVYKIVVIKRKTKKSRIAPARAAPLLTSDDRKERNVTPAFPEYTEDSVPEEEDAEKIKQIRQRIEREQNSEKKSTHEISYPMSIPDTSAIDPSSTKDNLESKVLRAYHDGMSIVSISRKFHISADHVSLILKMGEKKSSGH